MFTAFVVGSEGRAIAHSINIVLSIELNVNMVMVAVACNRSFIFSGIMVEQREMHFT
ncbi:hypothetical protein D3C80_1741960 [compost metagenome]